MSSPDPRVFCLLQSTDAHPGLAAAVPPPRLLSPREQARCDRFVVLKRRRDWLLGRWTAKHLVQSYLALVGGHPAPLDGIEILADDDGAPYASFGNRLPLSLSISHSGSTSFCAVCPSEVGAVGADVEQIEPRELSFVRTFFTAAENQAAEAALAADRDAVITALWSAKEAVLKTLRLGLRADTRQVEVHLAGLSAHWQAVNATVDPLILPAARATVAVWQQVHEAAVFSLALLGS